jgi:hypothetical protein
MEGMGGFGSGRRPELPGTVEDCLAIDASRWMREGILRDGVVRSGLRQWGASGQWSIAYQADASVLTVRLRYTIKNSGERFDYPISLQTTEPRFGGLRWWFTCPLSTGDKRCARRVRKLFLPPGCKYFGCRYCYSLTYQSRREDAASRALTKAQKIRVRLGGDGSIGPLFPARPKGMRNWTYVRLKAEADEAEMLSWILALRSYT